MISSDFVCIFFDKYLDSFVELQDGELCVAIHRNFGDVTPLLAVNTGEELSRGDVLDGWVGLGWGG